MVHMWEGFSPSSTYILMDGERHDSGPIPPLMIGPESTDYEPANEVLSAGS